ncbi:MAG: OmpH family outer membrane protein [Myxococcota bacterium]
MRSLVALLTLCGTTLASAQDVAVVDLQRALTGSNAGLRAQATLRQLHQQYQQRLDDQQREVRELYEKLQDAPPAERPAMEDEYRRKYTALQREYARMQQDLAAQEARETANILREVRRIAELLRRERGLSLVVELQNGQPPPTGPGAANDLTQDVIRRMNAAESRPTR